jgi:hypothetical protein
VHALALQAEPVKDPLVPHVQVPPPLYPASQITATVAPVVPVILEELALFEKSTFVPVHEFALHVGTAADHSLAALTTPLQVIELEPERV